MVSKRILNGRYHGRTGGFQPVKNERAFVAGSNEFVFRIGLYNLVMMVVVVMVSMMIIVTMIIMMVVVTMIVMAVTTAHSSKLYGCDSAGCKELLHQKQGTSPVVSEHHFNNYL